QKLLHFQCADTPNGYAVVFFNMPASFACGEYSGFFSVGARHAHSILHLHWCSLHSQMLANYSFGVNGTLVTSGNSCAHGSLTSRASMASQYGRATLYSRFAV